MNKEIKKEYIFKFNRLTSLDDDVIVAVVADNIEEAEKRAREKVKDKSVGEIDCIRNDKGELIAF